MSEQHGSSASLAPLAVQVRDLPSLRAACMPYIGPANEISRHFQRLEAFVAKTGIGPAGPLLCSFTGLIDNSSSKNHQEPNINAVLMVPVTRLVDDCDDGIKTQRLPSQRAACLLYSGPMDSSFRQRHLDLFTWLEAAELQHKGTAHQHAYLSREQHSDHWTVEIRVPILTQNTSTTAL